MLGRAEKSRKHRKLAEHSWNLKKILTNYLGSVHILCQLKMAADINERPLSLFYCILCFGKICALVAQENFILMEGSERTVPICETVPQESSSNPFPI